MSDLSAFPITRRWPARHPNHIPYYGLATPNGVKVSILLEEPGVPYEPHLVDIGEDESWTPEFLSLNPNGKIPAIIDPDGPGGQPIGLFESGAILLYLADKHGRFIPSEDDPKVYAPGTSLLPPERRVEHIALIKPDVCSLDLNTMNSGPDVVMNTPKNVRRMAKVIREAGVKPELEIFDPGDINLALDLIADGTLDGPGMWTFVLGVKYGFAPTPETLLYARNMLPRGAFWSAFGIGRMEFPIVAQAWLMGGHVRVGMEDNIYLSHGVLAESNAQLVAKARDIIRSLGGQVASAAEARQMLNLPAGGAR